MADEEILPQLVLYNGYKGQVNHFIRPVDIDICPECIKHHFLARVTEVSFSCLCKFSFYAILYIKLCDNVNTYFEALEQVK